MKAVVLISGGIDSPAAAYLMAKAGAEIILLHMDNRPYADDTGLAKVQDIRDQLELVTGQRIPLYVAPHGRNQALTAERCRAGFQCVICKRTMLRVARQVAMGLGAEAIITGESLGQVASQTLQNLKAESHGLDFPVLRPLIGLDKLEIESIAKVAGTLGISIRSPSACLIVPKRPVTMARLDKLLEEQAKLDLEEMVTFSADRIAEITASHTARS